MSLDKMTSKSAICPHCGRPIKASSQFARSLPFAALRLPAPARPIRVLPARSGRLS
jgi:hypothetical protein